MRRGVVAFLAFILPMLDDGRAVLRAFIFLPAVKLASSSSSSSSRFPPPFLARAAAGLAALDLRAGAAFFFFFKFLLRTARFVAVAGVRAEEADFLSEGPSADPNMDLSACITPSASCCVCRERSRAKK